MTMPDMSSPSRSEQSNRAEDHNTAPCVRYNGLNGGIKRRYATHTNDDLDFFRRSRSTSRASNELMMLDDEPAPKRQKQATGSLFHKIKTLLGLNKEAPNPRPSDRLSVLKEQAKSSPTSAVTASSPNTPIVSPEVSSPSGLNSTSRSFSKDVFGTPLGPIYMPSASRTSSSSLMFPSTTNAYLASAHKSSIRHPRISSGTQMPQQFSTVTAKNSSPFSLYSRTNSSSLVSNQFSQSHPSQLQLLRSINTASSDMTTIPKVHMAPDTKPDSSQAFRDAFNKQNPFARKKSWASVLPQQGPSQVESPATPSTHYDASSASQASSASDMHDNRIAEMETLRGSANKSVQEALSEWSSIQNALCDLEKILYEEDRRPRESESEEEDEDEDLVELTPEQEETIDNAMVPHPAGEVLNKLGLNEISRKDIDTLRGLNWLNDEVINYYLQLIVERSKDEGYPQVYATNTFFYPKLLNSGFSSVKRWTRKVDIFQYQMVLVPIHLGMHWCMAVIDFENKTIKYYDSMGGSNNDCLEALEGYLEDEHMDKKKTAFSLDGWHKENVKQIPQQGNGSDCGVFACKFAEYASRRAPFRFSQTNMPYFRRRMVLELVTNTLL